MTTAHTLRLVLGDQLHPGHSWFAQVDARVVYVLMEVRQETDYVLHHAQKILAIFAAMRDFARYLCAGGHRVRYVALDDPGNRQSIPGNLPVPAWALRLALGEMSVLLLGGQRLVPRRTQQTGFAWRYPGLAGALKQLLGSC